MILTGLVSKYFYLWNLLGLLLLALLFRFYQPDKNPIEWPVSYFLSVTILSFLFFSVKEFLNRKLILILSFTAFSTLMLLLTGFFEIILTRFFRLKEIYSFRSFIQYLIEHKTLLIDGIIWWSVYIFIFNWLKRQVQIQQLKNKNLTLERGLAKVDLHSLNHEINPHFLFNAMNSISMNVRMNKNKEAVHMIAALNDLLRLSLSKTNEQLITIEEELDLLNKYLLIEQSRFGQRITVVFDFPKKIQTLKVPRLILQPLVENAFKHGIKNSSEQMKVKIQGEELENMVSLLVFNSQVDRTRINYATSNVGLPNIVHRLRRFYGTDFQFQSFSEKEGIVFKIIIPKTQ